MSEKSGFFLFMTGLLTTMFGVGGVEQSLTDMALVQGALVALVGLAIMAIGVFNIKDAQ